MASWAHEGIIELFRKDPDLAPQLLRGPLGVEVPEYSEAKVESGTLTQLHPAELRADLVVRLASGTRSAMAIVIETQTKRDPNKLYSWPAYVTSLRHRLRCDVCLLVVAQSEPVADWAAQPIHLGPRGLIEPLVLRPSVVPIIDDPEDARKAPELAVLSALAHGGGSVETAVRVALAATTAAQDLDRDRFMLYFDLIVQALSQTAQEAFRMDSQGIRFFTKEFQQSYERLAVLEVRGFRITAEQRERIVRCSDLETLDRWHRRAVTVSSTDELFE